MKDPTEPLSPDVTDSVPSFLSKSVQKRIALQNNISLEELLCAETSTE